MLSGLKRFIKFEVGPKVGRFWRGGPNYSFCVSYEPEGDLIAVRGRGKERRLRMRPGSSDGEVFEQIFGAEDYSTEKMAQNAGLLARYEAIVASGKTPLIIDAGANIGLSALYFRDRYPEALIVAVEPEPRNFSELSRNVGDDPLTMPLNAAISASDGELRIVDPGEGAWGFRTSADGEGKSVPAYAPETLLALAKERGAVEPFIVKVDIEGFEGALFDRPSDWLDDFQLLIAELHDWMLPGEGTSRPLLRHLAERDRDFVFKGENIFSFKY